jgi:hypothetical protein
VARGLITFLIVITTMGIAIMLAISTLFGEDGTDQDKTFDKGKQVLSVLIGLLGTIVGFYFGSPDIKAASTPSSLAETQGLRIAPVNISMPTKKGEPIALSSYAYSGMPPYTYSITFDPDSIFPAIKDTSSLDGVIQQKLVVPDTLTTDIDVKFHIHVIDSDKQSLDYNKDGTQKISLKAK